ncbi:uncharacterized protein LOC133930684 [Phragmites australis]|uniref:uncharacterized protein LOC133930684 n=1 Tax=Phragmites australis TaxID=29695 RepID=UPI002D791288|nr:uncharacterized protein LOC133930684 [Phragmites australis]
MASHTTLTVIFGFAAVFCCLQLLEATTKFQTSQSLFARLAAGAFLSVVLTTFTLTPLLLFAYVRALGRANAPRGSEDHFLGRLARATLLTAMAALVAGAVLRLVAGGFLGGADDVGWLNTK